MRLATSINPGAEGGTWWYVERSAGSRGPIVGVEQRVSRKHVRQWLLDDRGVRCFDYHGRNDHPYWGPPLPTTVFSDDFSIVPSLVRARFGNADEPGWPGPRLPLDEVNAVRDSGGLVDLLERHWPDTQTAPPAHMTAHAIAQAMEAAKITISDVAKVGM